MSDTQHDTIRRRAHQIWERHGRPPGREEEFWLLAEQELRLERARHDDWVGDPFNAPEGSHHRTRGLATGGEHGGA